MGGINDARGVGIASVNRGEPSKDSPIFGERSVALAVPENQPMTRVGSAGSFAGSIMDLKLLEDHIVKDKSELTDLQKNNLVTMKNNLLNAQQELTPNQQSMVNTVVNHINHALDQSGSAQSFMLGLAKKELEKLEADIQMNPVSASDVGKSERSGEHALAGLLNKLITFLGSLLASKPTPHEEEGVAVVLSEVEEVEVFVEPEVFLLKVGDPDFVQRKDVIFQKLNKAINELAGLSTDVLYTPETEARYVKQYNDFEKELDGLAKDTGLDKELKDNDHPLIGEYNRLRLYQENTKARIEALKAPKGTEKPVDTRTAEDEAADDEFAKAAAQAKKQGF